MKPTLLQPEKGTVGLQGVFPLKSEQAQRPRILVERIPAPFASLYEKAARLAVKTYYGPVAEEIVASFQAGRILDLGTGPGYLPVEIVRRAPEIRATGIDLSRRLLRTGVRNASAAGVGDRVAFEVGNASRLRWPDHTFDMVTCTGMLHMLKDPVGVLRECRRVLRPGGAAWFDDPAGVFSTIHMGRWKASLTRGERILYALFRVYARIHPGRRYGSKDVAALIATAGFREHGIWEERGEVRARMTK